jgi:hypothetical protein
MNGICCSLMQAAAPMADSAVALPTVQQRTSIGWHKLRLLQDLALTAMIAIYAYSSPNNQANAQKIRSRQKQSA